MRSEKKNNEGLGSYQGMDYSIVSKGKFPYTYYKAVCDDLGIKTEWKYSPIEAGSQLRKLIDESIQDLGVNYYR